MVGEIPKVSVIVPNYNHAPYLAERLESILRQSYQDFELIYLDDASTDDSDCILKKYAGDPRFQIIRNDVNSGSTFKQWNKGVRHAKGDYLWIAESDDYADPRFLEELVQQLEQNSNVGLAYCQSWQVDESGMILRSLEEWTAHLHTTRWQSNFVADGKEECKRYLLPSSTIPNASAVLVRRVAYEQVCGADESFYLCGDWLLWAKILLTWDIAFVAKSLNYFRDHTQTVRMHSYKNSLFLEEYYRVISFIIHNVSLPKSDLIRIYDEMGGQWISALRVRQLTAKQHLRTYRLARRLDKRIGRRLLRIFVMRSYAAAERRLKLKLN